jgi:hypothetical protein
MNLNPSRTAPPLRVPVIQRDFNQSTVYFVSERDFKVLWGAIGPAHGDPASVSAFVAPQHRLLVVCLYAQEVQTKEYQQGKARLSPLRLLEIHQGIRYGLTRLRGASEARALACLSAGFERWQDAHNIQVGVPQSELSPIKAPVDYMLTAGPIEVLVVDKKSWSLISPDSSASPKTYRIQSLSDKIQCVTMHEDIQALLDHLREDPRLRNSIETALAIQALSEHARRKPFTELQNKLVEHFTPQELGLSSIPDTFAFARLAHNLRLLAEEFETPPHDLDAQDKAWLNVLRPFGLQVDQGNLSSDAFVTAIECAQLVIDEANTFPGISIRFESAIIKERLEQWMRRRPGKYSLSNDIRTRLRDRTFLPEPHERATRAHSNRLGKEAAPSKPMHEIQLINHQTARVSPGPFRDAYAADLRAASIFPIAEDVTPSSNLIAPKRVSGAKYLQLSWEFEHTIELTGLGRATCLLLIRHHSRTQGKKEEYPCYRYTLHQIRIPDDATKQPVSQNLLLEALNIPIVATLPPAANSPFILNSANADADGPRFFHPALGRQGIPLSALGLHLSSCSRYVFGRSIRDPGLKFIDLDNKVLRESLPQSLNWRTNEPHRRKEITDQLVDFIENTAHFTYIPSNMNLALEPLDLEL